ncbi:MAG: heavy metal translocating P-type ATPase [Spirochaetaceae bacterium]
MALCRSVMQETLDKTPGVYCIQFDPIHRNLVWRYKQAELPEGTLPTEELLALIGENIRECSLARPEATPHTCHSCRIQKANRQGCPHLRHLAEEGMITVYSTEGCPPPEVCDSLSTTLLPVQVGLSGSNGGAGVSPSAEEQSPAPETAVTARSQPPESSATKTGRPVHRRLTLSERLAALPLEPLSVVVTFLSTALGLVLERTIGMGAAAIGAYLVAYLSGGYFGLRAGIESLKQRQIDIDLLMILAALGAALIGAPFEGGLLLLLFSLSNVLQDFAMDRTRNAIRSLMKLRPARAEVLEDGERRQISVESVGIGDVFFVKPGDRVPLDGTILSGEAAMDESLLTGESRPTRKGPGDRLLAGSINTNGSLQAEVTRTAGDSTIAKIIRLVEEAQGRKAKTERFLDTFEQYYAIFVILLTIAFAAAPVLLWSEPFTTAFYRAITVMVAASPCALIISTPASVLSAIGAGAKRGVLFKGGVYVEQAGTVKAIAFDKTGTLTYGKPELTDVVSFDNGVSEDEIVALAAAVEQHSEHVLAKATVEAARGRGEAILDESVAFEAVAGKGVEATVDGRRIRIGAPAYFDNLEISNKAAADRDVHRLRRESKTVVAVTEMEGDSAGRILGLVAFADRLRHNAREVVAELRRLGIGKIVMLTGDNDETAQAIAREVGVDEVYSQLLPEEKLAAIEELEARHGSVAMIGDGVNDAPSLARATLGVAMGAGGTDVALETADVVLMADELEQIPYLVALSRRTRRTLIFNLGLAVTLILMMIGGIVLYSLPLPLAVIGHEGGTVLVSLNGLRLLLYHPSRARQSGQ